MLSPASRAENRSSDSFERLAPKALCCRPLRGLKNRSSDSFERWRPQALCLRPLRRLESSHAIAHKLPRGGRTIETQPLDVVRQSQQLQRTDTEPVQIE